MSQYKQAEIKDFNGNWGPIFRGDCQEKSFSSPYIIPIYHTSIFFCFAFLANKLMAKFK